MDFRPRRKSTLTFRNGGIYRATRYIVSEGHIVSAKRIYHATSAEGAIPKRLCSLRTARDISALPIRYTCGTICFTRYVPQAERVLHKRYQLIKCIFTRRCQRQSAIGLTYSHKRQRGFHGNWIYLGKQRFGEGEECICKCLRFARFALGIGVA